MARTNAGEAWELFALMKDGKFVMLVAKDPNKPSVTDITDDLAILLQAVGDRSASAKTETET